MFGALARGFDDSARRGDHLRVDRRTPGGEPKSLLALVALIPAATAVFIYVFVGNFYAGHLLLGVAVAAAAAARSMSSVVPSM